MECPDSSSNVSPDEGRFQTPPLRAIHIIFWIAATAVLFGLCVAEDNVFGREVGPWTTNLLHLIYAMLLGAVFVAAGILVRISRLTSIDRLEPGHWLIINSAVLGLFNALTSTIWRYTANVAGEADSLLMVGLAVCTLISATLFWFAATRLPETEQWKGAFRIFALAHLFGAINLVGFPLPSADILPDSILVLVFLLMVMALPVFFGLYALISFLSAVANDVRTKCQRDRLHWLGVATVVIFPLILFAWSITMYLALP